MILRALSFVALALLAGVSLWLGGALYHTRKWPDPRGWTHPAGRVKPRV